MSTSAADVVVTGLGATTPLGGDVASTWEALLAGRSGSAASPTTGSRTSRPSSSPGWPPTRPSRSTGSRPAAGPQPAGRASSPPRRPGGRRRRRRRRRPACGIAVVFGTGIGGALTLLGQDDVLEEKGPKRVSPFTIPMLMPNGPAAAVGLAVGARAGVHAPVSACAPAPRRSAGPGPDPVRPRRHGRRRRHRGVRAPAADGRLRRDARDVHPQRRARAGLPPVRQGPGRVRARRGRRRARAGARRARRRPRGAGLRAARRRRDHRRRLRHRRPAPEGEGAARAIDAALRDAGLDPADIGHVNAHATSTPVGDIAEATAINAAIGDHALVTATKSETGHLLGAAGAVESIATVLALRDGDRAGTANLDDLDDGVQASTSSPWNHAGCRCRPPSTTPSASAATTWPWSFRKV